MRILPTCCLVVLVALCASLSNAAERDERRPPNILFIMVDDLGREWVSSYGSQSIKTPVIDQLARDGMKFDNFYVMPQCTPTRTTLLTGQYPFRHGWVNHWDVPRWGSGCHFDPKHNMSFARLMQKAGYKTAAAGKWQINDFRVQPKAMADHGFDEWCMWTGYETGNKPSAERYWKPYVNTPEGSKTYQSEFGADVFTDFLIDFMRRHRDEPMMLYFPMALTHGPLVATPNDPKANGKIEKHVAMVHYVEHCVQRLLDALDELKLADDTIVIFTTDNGTSGGVTGTLGERPVKGSKAKTNEAGTRMPFIARCPTRIPAGTVCNELSDISDMLPTFLELAGSEPPSDLMLDGHSIAPLLLGKSKQGSREWILSMGHGPARFENGRVRGKQPYFARVIRDKQYKVWVAGGKGPKVTALYDLQKDPFEQRNLVDSKSLEHKVAKDKFAQIIAAHPQQDAIPKYDPLPSEKWDKHSR